jgi:glycosyltransferase involved in cell wall biosynthesis
MKILQVLTYYRPHISGLTIYVERLSKALAQQGHEVTVMTSQYDHDLARFEIKDNVAIRRVPVAFRVSKGVIMPTFGPMAWKMVQWADVIHLHLPQFDAPGVAFRGRLYKKPVILTYHSDLRLPDGFFNRIIDQVVHSMNRIAGNLADVVVTYTYDFGSHSPFLSKYVGKKLAVIPPPVELAQATENQVAVFRNKYKLASKSVIGISARMASEKGIEVLLHAMPAVLDKHPDAFILHASPDAIGESTYARRIEPLLKEHAEHYKLLGALEGSDLTAFYRNLDCLVMCSLNNTETFGLVQIEAMMNGVPAVASDLPGVRQPVRMTGMGEIVPVGDHVALAKAIIHILDKEESYRCPPEIIAKTFSPEQTASEYLHLYDDLLAGKQGGSIEEPAGYGLLRQMRDSA